MAMEREDGGTEPEPGQLIGRAEVPTPSHLQIARKN